MTFSRITKPVAAVVAYVSALFIPHMAMAHTAAVPHTHPHGVDTFSLEAIAAIGIATIALAILFTFMAARRGNLK